MWTYRRMGIPRLKRFQLLVFQDLHSHLHKAQFQNRNRQDQQ
jgi:hypothetical protein